MCLHSLSATGEREVGRREGHRLHFGGHRLEPALY